MLAIYSSPSVIFIACSVWYNKNQCTAIIEVVFKVQGYTYMLSSFLNKIWCCNYMHLLLPILDGCDGLSSAFILTLCFYF